MNKNRRVAVVGSGVSGAVAAWLLRNHSDVTLFEASDRFGGHTNTAQIEDEWGRVAIDTGFMVFNEPNYPLLTSLFRHLGVDSYPTGMSFSASIDSGRLEYAGTDLSTLFGQRRNLANPRFWGMLMNILRFNRRAHGALASSLDPTVTLDSFLDGAGCSQVFRDHYLYPMAAAIWSCPRGEIGGFPAQTFLRFFGNHGLINIRNRPQWQTVDGGSSEYMHRLIDDLGERALGNSPVVAVTRHDTGVDVVLQGNRHQRFDDVILACHSDQALRLVNKASPSETAILRAIPYQSNRVMLHRDASLMPTQRRVWASWNYLSESGVDASRAVAVTYWMNSLQRLSTPNNYFVSLNPLREPDPDRVVAEYEYQHPVFGLDALAAQKQLHRIQGRGGVWYAGAWTGYGFHEDGIRSAVEVAAALGASVPWGDQVKASQELTVVPQRIRKAA